MKLLRMAFKDLRIAFRDRTGILLMLVAPVVLTLGMALVSGRLTNSGESTISRFSFGGVRIRAKLLLKRKRTVLPKTGFVQLL